MARPRPAGVDVRVGAVWPGGPPASAAENLRLYVHRPRKVVGGDVTERRGGGALVKESSRLGEQRLGAWERCFDVELRLVTRLELVAEIQVLVADGPYRERLWGQLMLALHRAGRDVEALRAYRDLYATLTRELGVDPGRELGDTLVGVGRAGRCRSSSWSARRVGKTALVVRWAHRVRDRFPDGLFFLGLRGFHNAGGMR